MSHLFTQQILTESLKCCKYRQYIEGMKEIESSTVMDWQVRVNEVTNKCVVSWKGKMDTRRKDRLFWKISSGTHHVCWALTSEWLHYAQHFALVLLLHILEKHTALKSILSQLTSTPILPPNTWDRLISNAETISVTITRIGLPPSHRSFQTIKQLCRYLHWM